MSMRAIACDRFGGPEVLKLVELPEPKVGPHTVLVRARAAGINPVDYKIREGGLAELIPTGFPLISGFDVAGVVERVGPAVTRFSPGDEVMADNKQDHIQDGSYAELVPVPERLVAHRPRSGSWAQAAALPLAGLTAAQCLDSMGTTGDDVVLVHAASGGVGRMAVQIARIIGARVIGTARASNHQLLNELGAEAVSYGDGLVERVRQICPEGVDAVVDLVGGQALDDSPDLLRRPGRLVSVIDPHRVAELGGQYIFVEPDGNQLSRLANWVDEGRLRVDIDSELPLADAADAQRRQEAGETHGKLVLTIST
jgi:NADPH:quinone reductase-like Zn-dependent oxidoreductase